MPRANELTKPVQIVQTVPPLRSVQSVIDEHKSEGSFHVREFANVETFNFCSNRFLVRMLTNRACSSSLAAPLTERTPCGNEAKPTHTISVAKVSR
jgi:hypothetical protein